jgi:hypothetical protein
MVLKKSLAIEIAYKILVSNQMPNFMEEYKIGVWAILLVKVMCFNS